MDISFNCDKCGQQIVIDASGAGNQVQCPKCSAVLIVPSAAKQQPRKHLGDSPLSSDSRQEKLSVPKSTAAVTLPKQQSPLRVVAGTMLGVLGLTLSVYLVYFLGFKSAKPVSLGNLLPDYTIDGEVFVVDRDGKSTKLSLVPVGLVSLDELIPYLKNKIETANRETVRLRALIEAANAEAAPLKIEKDRLQEVSDKLLNRYSELSPSIFHDKLGKTLKEQYEEAHIAYTNAVERWTPVNDRLYKLKSEEERYHSNEYYLDRSFVEINSWRQLFENLGTALASGNLTGARQALTQLEPEALAHTRTNNDPFSVLCRDLNSGDLHDAQTAYANIQQMIHHRDSEGSFPKTTQIAKTDADGKFQMQVPRTGDFALLAVADDTAWGKMFWMVKIPSNGAFPRKIMLTNRNNFNVLSSGQILRDP